MNPVTLDRLIQTETDTLCIRLQTNDWSTCSASLARLIRYAPDDAPLAFYRATHHALNAILNQELEDWETTWIRLNESGRKAQIACATAVRLATRFSMAEPLRQLALDRAQSLEGLGEHIDWMSSASDNEPGEDDRFDGPQKAFLCSIHLAHALENAGAGLDREQLIAMSRPLQDIITTSGGLTELGLAIFEDHDGDFEHHMLGENDELSPAAFFKKIAVLTEASKIAEATAPSTTCSPRKRM